MEVTISSLTTALPTMDSNVDGVERPDCTKRFCLDPYFSTVGRAIERACDENRACRLALITCHPQFLIKSGGLIAVSSDQIEKPNLLSRSYIMHPKDGMMPPPAAYSCRGRTVWQPIG